MKNIMISLLAILLLGCSNPTYLTTEQVIEKCKKCQEQGMNVKIYSNVIGYPLRVKCVPTKKQVNP